MIAFLKINEERVREYEVPIYNPTLDSQNVEQYPEEVSLYNIKRKSFDINYSLKVKNQISKTRNS